MDSAKCWVFTKTGSPQTLQSISLDCDLRPGEVLVQLAAATICGSDIHTIEGRRVDPAAPLVLGHEGMGVVIKSASSAEVGDRVTWAVASSCGHCAACTSWELPQKCSTASKVGHASFLRERAIEGLAGTYGSHILLPPGTPIVRESK
jgi:D-arabinose 1-dehydrogenase-like Zn-dependent alcohol dehydrogenase